METLRLFGLKQIGGSELLIADLFFTKKEDAKKERIKRNQKNKDGEEILDFVVTRGPDHMDGFARPSTYRTEPGRKGVKRGTKSMMKAFQK